VLSLAALILVGVIAGASSGVIKANFAHPFSPADVVTVQPELPLVPATAATAGLFGLFVAMCVAQVGSLFSTDAWNNITFAAGEVRDPRRTIPLAMAAGCALVVVLYLLVNVAYLVTLPLSAIQSAPDDRVATAALQTIFGDAGAGIMAVAIVISTFGCSNGIVLAGSARHVCQLATGCSSAYQDPQQPARSGGQPGPAGLWACLLILPRTRLYDAGGTLTGPALAIRQRLSNLLDYVVFAVIFYVLTLAALFVLRRRRLTPAAVSPSATRCCRRSHRRRVGDRGRPARLKTQTTWPGLAIVLTGIPAYLLWRRFSQPQAPPAVGG
jgi:APA family basic amino acid/polyamine antiporter